MFAETEIAQRYAADQEDWLRRQLDDCGDAGHTPPVADGDHDDTGTFAIEV